MGKDLIFRFKQFAVSHSESSMRVGTDAVSLGAWAECQGAVLDVGCGCGVIGLMAAQRGAAAVDMIDIDMPSVNEAAKNAANSPWAKRISVRCQNFLDCSGTYDSILSNPPYFASGLPAPDLRRAAARHESILIPDAFMKKASQLLSPDGTISIIIPPDRLQPWCFAAELAGLYPSVICRLLTKPSAESRRIMVAFSHRKTSPITQDLSLNSPQYKLLTEDFYL